MLKGKRTLSSYVMLFSEQNLKYKEAFVVIFCLYTHDIIADIKKCSFPPFVTNGFWNVSITLSMDTH